MTDKKRHSRIARQHFVNAPLRSRTSFNVGFFYSSQMNTKELLRGNFLPIRN